jgi:anaerobic selenocysteine-containing dehydrogenase
MSVEDAGSAQLTSGDVVRVSAGGVSVDATAVVRTGVPTGSIFVLDAGLPAGAVEIAPVRGRTEVPA